MRQMDFVHVHSSTQPLANGIPVQALHIIALRHKLVLLRLIQNHCVRLATLTTVLQQQLAHDGYISHTTLKPTLALLVLVAVRLFVVTHVLAIAQNATVRKLQLARRRGTQTYQRILVRLRVVVEVLELLEVIRLHVIGDEKKYRGIGHASVSLAHHVVASGHGTLEAVIATEANATDADLLSEIVDETFHVRNTFLVRDEEAMDCCHVFEVSAYKCIHRHCTHRTNRCPCDRTGNDRVQNCTPPE